MEPERAREREGVRLVHSQSINDSMFSAWAMAHVRKRWPWLHPCTAHMARCMARGPPPPTRGPQPTLRQHCAHTPSRAHRPRSRITRAVSSTHVWHNPRQITLCDYTPTISFFGKGGLFRMNQRHTGTRAEPQCAQSRQSTHAAAHHTRHTVRQWKTRQKRVTSTWCGKDSVQTGCGEDSAQESRFWSGLARL